MGDHFRRENLCLGDRPLWKPLFFIKISWRNTWEADPGFKKCVLFQPVLSWPLPKNAEILWKRMGLANKHPMVIFKYGSFLSHGHTPKLSKLPPCILHGENGKHAAGLGYVSGFWDVSKGRFEICRTFQWRLTMLEFLQSQVLETREIDPRNLGVWQEVPLVGKPIAMIEAGHPGAPVTIYAAGKLLGFLWVHMIRNKPSRFWGDK